jgi:hypothetical protein
VPASIKSIVYIALMASLIAYIILIANNAAHAFSWLIKRAIKILIGRLKEFHNLNFVS